MTREEIRTALEFAMGGEDVIDRWDVESKGDPHGPPLSVFQVQVTTTQGPHWVAYMATGSEQPWIIIDWGPVSP